MRRQGERERSGDFFYKVDDVIGCKPATRPEVVLNTSVEGTASNIMSDDGDDSENELLEKEMEKEMEDEDKSSTFLPSSPYQLPSSPSPYPLSSPYSWSLPSTPYPPSSHQESNSDQEN